MKKIHCFKSYDIRGKLGSEINEDIAYLIGRAFGEYEKAENVVVGSDIRPTSENLKLALCRGLQDSGVNVLDIGLSGTEEIYFATFHLGLDGGIQITASHNPIDYNGMKLVRKNSSPISEDTGLKEIQKLAESNNFLIVGTEKKGWYKKVSTLDSYIDHLMSYITPTSIKPLKLVVNSGNGVAGHVINELEKRFIHLNIPVTFVKINNIPDGSFPNGIPNPLLPENRQDTIDAVLKYHADIGIAFDGDFDRCFFFDKNGEFIEGYYIVGLLAKSFLQKEPNASIIYDPRLYWNTQDIISSMQGTPVMSKTGHAFIKDRMRKEDAIYGGEMSAHHYFRDFSYCDSGMIPWLLIIELISNSEKGLNQLVHEMINKYPSSGEINNTVEDPDEIIKKIRDLYINDAINYNYIDGLSLEFEDWRFNLRKSNTESLLRLNVESRNDVDLMKNKTNELLKLITSNN